MAFPYDNLPLHHRNLEAVEDITEFDMIEDNHSKWLCVSESRTIDELWDVCTRKDDDFAKSYKSFINKRWHKVVKTPVPDARNAAEFLTGIPGENGNPPLHKGDIVATFIAPDTHSTTLAKYGKDFWVGRVTNVFDATKGVNSTSNRWARNEGGEHYDFEVCLRTEGGKFMDP
jgi:hypothetical protein